MPALTRDEKRLICLALDEYASAFDFLLTAEESAQVHHLAQRLRKSTLETKEKAS